ncbi:uncharacterized protein K444DRAFT_704232 [Hyaloscypha bicolor E]|uniref:Uncharacterized protein n=1 Tax=Hyaloscypha bicolor E TaxID=1095630 RepID=A0A2J6SQ01_9HELO|nr:uncharacterized protein K444DRAFT_704232 [Hyaloscypha bicolor E]PMD52817.1 hypothetical protein K444DRAFT_704232 [Hyaloscypha bicolor E]
MMNSLQINGQKIESALAKFVLFGPQVSLCNFVASPSGASSGAYAETTLAQICYGIFQPLNARTHAVLSSSIGGAVAAKIIAPLRELRVTYAGVASILRPNNTGIWLLDVWPATSDNVKVNFVLLATFARCTAPWSSDLDQFFLEQTKQIYPSDRLDIAQAHAKAVKTACLEFAKMMETSLGKKERDALKILEIEFGQYDMGQAFQSSSPMKLFDLFASDFYDIIARLKNNGKVEIIGPMAILPLMFLDLAKDITGYQWRYKREIQISLHDRPQGGLLLVHPCSPGSLPRISGPNSMPSLMHKHTMPPGKISSLVTVSIRRWVSMIAEAQISIDPSSWDRVDRVRCTILHALVRRAGDLDAIMPVSTRTTTDLQVRGAESWCGCFLCGIQTREEISRSPTTTNGIPSCSNGSGETLADVRIARHMCYTVPPFQKHSATPKSEVDSRQERNEAEVIEQLRDGMVNLMAFQHSQLKKIGVHIRSRDLRPEQSLGPTQPSPNPTYPPQPVLFDIETGTEVMIEGWAAVASPVHLLVDGRVTIASSEFAPIENVLRRRSGNHGYGGRDIERLGHAIQLLASLRRQDVIPTLLEGSSSQGEPDPDLSDLSGETICHAIEAQQPHALAVEANGLTYIPKKISGTDVELRAGKRLHPTTLPVMMTPLCYAVAVATVLEACLGSEELDRIEIRVENAPFAIPASGTTGNILWHFTKNGGFSASLNTLVGSAILAAEEGVAFKRRADWEEGELIGIQTRLYTWLPPALHADPCVPVSTVLKPVPFRWTLENAKEDATIFIRAPAESVLEMHPPVDESLYKTFSGLKNIRTARTLGDRIAGQSLAMKFQGDFLDTFKSTWSHGEIGQNHIIKEDVSGRQLTINVVYCVIEVPQSSEICLTNLGCDLGLQHATLQVIVPCWGKCKSTVGLDWGAEGLDPLYELQSLTHMRQCFGSKLNFILTSHQNPEARMALWQLSPTAIFLGPDSCLRCFVTRDEPDTLESGQGYTTANIIQ